MIASNVTRETLEAAAAEVGVSISVGALSGSGRRHGVRLYPSVPADCYTPSGRRKRGERGDAPYQRESVGYGTAGRRVHAVCWHGFRDFFRAVFRREPEARFYTALDTWRGSADFEARFRASGFRNVGPPIAPGSVASACRCPEAGSVDDAPGPETRDAYVPEWAEPLATAGR